MQNSLLTHIASNFISEYENVANSSVCYLLNQYPAARTTLKNLLSIDKVPSHFETELATKQNGRPDITGLSRLGEKQVIIEGKFWANLTDNQPENYLKELSADGKILFLAPEQRLISLNVEIENRLNGTNHKVIICAWLDFLNQIERENNKNHNHKLASDLSQIKGLCQKMDTEGMPPLSQADLSPMHGRISYQLAQLLDDCYFLLKQWGDTDFSRLQKANSKYGYGFYFKAFGFTCRLWFDNYQWFKLKSQTPFGLTINKNWKSSQRIRHLLKEFNAKNTNEDSISIQLQAGMDKEQIVNHIVQQTKSILVFINERIT